MKIIFSLAVLFAAPTLNAQTCPSRVDLYLGVQAQSFYYKSMKSCAVQVSPAARKEVYRSYSFFSTGLFMIFNNLSSGDEATSTSSRSFFFFPRTSHPSYQLTRAGLQVTLSNGAALLFDYKTAMIKSAGRNGIEVKEDPKVNGQNEGGVEIKSHNGILLDTGYLVGEVGHSIPSRFSLVRDRQEKSCKLRNDLLFTYIYGTDPYGRKKLLDVSFKFPTDREFAAYLQGACPALDVQPLIKGLTRSVAQKSKRQPQKKI